LFGRVGLVAGVGIVHVVVVVVVATFCVAVLELGI
jgi:hypothetical protein